MKHLFYARRECKATHPLSLFLCSVLFFQVNPGTLFIHALPRRNVKIAVVLMGPHLPHSSLSLPSSSFLSLPSLQSTRSFFSSPPSPLPLPGPFLAPPLAPSSPSFSYSPVAANLVQISLSLPTSTSFHIATFNFPLHRARSSPHITEYGVLRWHTAPPPACTIMACGRRSATIIKLASNAAPNRLRRPLRLWTATTTAKRNSRRGSSSPPITRNPCSLQI